MEVKSRSTSLSSLHGSDSGVSLLTSDGVNLVASDGETLVTYDALVRKTEQQQKEIREKDVRIENLEETVDNLQDIIKKCELFYILTSVMIHLLLCR